MQKIIPGTPDLTDKKIEEISKIFPNVITEKEDDQGNTVKAVDFDLLRQELSKQIVEDDNERYRLDWPGKKRSLLKANTPIDKTLRPVREESVNFDTTENLYIEGDNFEALKILQESYLGKVKMIYIDPPYNTGKDFVYRDNFKKSKAEYEEELDITDEEGGKLVKNTDTNGRFHSDWLSMMYERLLISRDLLRDDGVIFISIDDNEVHNLRKICDEVFGEENFVANFIWRKKTTTSNVKDAQVSSQADYQLCYAKSESFKLKQRVRSSDTRSYPEKDELGRFRLAIIEKKDSGSYKRETMKFKILGHPPRDGKRWQIGETTARELEKKKRFIFDGEKIKLKIYDFEDNDTYSAQPNLLLKHGSSDEGAKEVNDDLFSTSELFDNPKPVKLASFLIEVASNKDSIICDFFSGSSTTAHAVMQLNAEDDGNRKFIMVQIPEETDENSEAYKAGYKTITEIGKERIRRAAKKIEEDYKDELAKRELPLDTGFRVFKVDSTNIEDVARHPSELAQESLLDLVDNVKPDRTPEDLLIEIMLNSGLELSLPIVRKEINYKTVFFVAENSLVACFDKEIDEQLVDEIAKIKPLRVVFRDASFKDDKDRINIENRFKVMLPDAPDNIVNVI
ncbi:MAG: site-specific DNA-methyltransferase [Bacillota bacterium]|nr:site-specific DNA-methyltransferase [Bacillota bacterium]